MPGLSVDTVSGRGTDFRVLMMGGIEQVPGFDETQDSGRKLQIPWMKKEKHMKTQWKHAENNWKHVYNILHNIDVLQ